MASQESLSSKMTSESKHMKALLQKLLPPLNHQLINYSWNQDDAGPNLFVNSMDAFIVYKYGEEASTDCIRGKCGFDSGVHAWEIVWRMSDRGPFPIAGVATSESPLFEEGEKVVVGNSNQSWGWDLSTCRLYHNSVDGAGKLYPESLLPEGMTMTVAEKITLLLDMEEGTLSYITDDTYLGVAFDNLKGLKLYPIVNITKHGAQVDMKYLGSLAPSMPEK